MLTHPFGEFELLIVTKGEDYDQPPFSATFSYEVLEDSISTYSVCNDIPCSLCPICKECQEGANRTTALYNLVKTNYPKLFL